MSSSLLDSRLELWAQMLTGYCADVSPGERVLIRSTPLAEPLILATYRACLGAGAHTTVLMDLPGAQELFLKLGTDEQLREIGPFERSLAEFDVTFTLLAANNNRSLSSVDPDRQRIFGAARSALRQSLMNASATGARRWTLTLYPTQAYAQDAGMSLSDFEALLLNACFLNDVDPAARWRELSETQQTLVDRLKGAETVRILAQGTDLTFGIKDRIFINSDGKRNFPSGEFFTGPVEDSANGTIQFNFPVVADGRMLSGIRLRFEAGEVVEARSDQNEAYLRAMLSMDPGARRIGEFAFGNNPAIRQFTSNRLLDEKIWGTIHLALGASYPETGGVNRSGLHWDLVCDLRSESNGGQHDGGEVWVDGRLFARGGEFVIPNDSDAPDPTPPG